LELRLAYAEACLIRPFVPRQRLTKPYRAAQDSPGRSKGSHEAQRNLKIAIGIHNMYKGIVSWVALYIWINHKVL
jgi:hypothetical protein